MVSARRAVPIAAAVLVAAALVGALLVLVLGEDQPPLAVRLLDRSRGFLAEARSATFETTTKIEADEELGGDFTVEGKGVVAFPDRFRLSEESDGYTVEVIGIGEAYFVRESDDADDLGEEKWAEYDPADDDERSGVVRPPVGDEGLAGDPSGRAAGSPTELGRILRNARAPRVVRETDGGRAVVRADLDADRAFGDVIGEDLDSATVEVTTTRRGRMSRIVIAYEAPEEKASIDYRLSAWDRPVQVAAPPEAEIDPTPTIDEEDIAEFTAAPLLQPAAIPEGWVFDGAFVLSPDETVEGCEQVELDYVDPDDPDAGFLWIYLLPVSCADLVPPPGSDNYPGRPGWISEDEGFTDAQVVVGATVVQVQSDLPPDAIVAVLAELVPFDPNRRPGQLEGLGPSSSA
jgi:hypothetical protein